MAGSSSPRTYTNPNGYRHPRAVADSNSGSDRYRNAGAIRHSYCNRHTESRTDGYRDATGDGYRHGDSDCLSDGYPHSQVYRHCDKCGCRQCFSPV